MTQTTELTEAEMEEHKNCCVDRPTAWEMSDQSGAVRNFECKKHGVPESYDLANAEKLDKGAWRL